MTIVKEDATDLEHLSPERFAYINYIFIVVNNTPEAYLSAHELATRLGFKESGDIEYRADNAMLLIHEWNTVVQHLHWIKRAFYGWLPAAKTIRAKLPLIN
ncbi:MAG: hypothetical protein E3K38_13215 [Candidatus Kuenenia stuttgartiensis]|nr:hypothetical protein [Candidatus Kuenenia stuttgartiensis]